MKTKRESLPTDIHLWKWSVKGRFNDCTCTFKGTTEAPRDMGHEVSDQADKMMRKKYPEARWMHGKVMEPADGSMTFGPTIQRGKFLRPSPENAEAIRPATTNPNEA